MTTDDFRPLAEKDLSHRPDWPTFPADAAHAAGCELVMLGYMIWPDTATSDSLIGRRPLQGRQAWSAKVGTFDQLPDVEVLEGQGRRQRAPYSKSRPTDVGRSSMCRASSAASICSILTFGSAGMSTSGTGTMCERRNRPPSCSPPPFSWAPSTPRPAVERVEAVMQAEGHPSLPARRSRTPFSALTESCTLRDRRPSTTHSPRRTSFGVVRTWWDRCPSVGCVPAGDRAAPTQPAQLAGAPLVWAVTPAG